MMSDHLLRDIGLPRMGICFGDLGGVDAIRRKPGGCASENVPGYAPGAHAAGDGRTGHGTVRVSASERASSAHDVEPQSL